jgi:hydroxymethyl cephem carbamoyltransferase
VAGAGYEGLAAVESTRAFFGKQVRWFSSTHERSHVYGAVGMAPPEPYDLQAVLVWEGLSGAFHLVDERYEIVRRLPVLDQPSSEYAACSPCATRDSRPATARTSRTAAS